MTFLSWIREVGAGCAQIRLMLYLHRERRGGLANKYKTYIFQRPMSHCKHIMNIKKKIWLDRKTEFFCFFGFLLQPCFSCFFPFNSKFPSPTSLFILQPCFILVFLPSFPFSFPLSLPLPLFFHSPSFDFFLTFCWPWYGGGGRIQNFIHHDIIIT